MEQIKLGLRIASIVVGIIGYSAIWMWLINNRRNEKVNLRGYYGNTFMQLRLRLRFFGLGFRRIRMLDDKCCGTCKCPVCGGITDTPTEVIEECIQYCGWCGQRLDWSDEQ